MCSYLHKAPNGVYYFRMIVPADLRPFMGDRREIKKSLGIKDRDVAKLAIPDHTKAAHSLLDQARRDRDVCRQFQGHEGRDAADKYGSAPSMRVLVEAIASYRVPGLVLRLPQ